MIHSMLPSESTSLKALVNASISEILSAPIYSQMLHFIYIHSISGCVRFMFDIDLSCQDFYLHAHARNLFCIGDIPAF